jgi:CxxC motif-containing protein (DUF1111 family)
MEAVRDDEIERIEREQAARDDGVSGRINRVPYGAEPNPDQPFHAHDRAATGLIGRFGLKARIATIDEFTADAYQGDMGITSTLRPDEPPNPDGLTDDARPGPDVSAEVVNLTADYVRLLALPRREDGPPEGPELFERVGCASCHVPSLRTRSDYPIPQLAGIDVAVFTDFLVHDMGEGLADGIVEHGASGREWRTAPLIGLRHMPSYLHDGRASTLEEAIEAHGAEDAESRRAYEAFRALDEPARQMLVSYVSTL